MSGYRGSHSGGISGSSWARGGSGSGEYPSTYSGSVSGGYHHHSYGSSGGSTYSTGGHHYEQYSGSATSGYHQAAPAPTSPGAVPVGGGSSTNYPLASGTQRNFIGKVTKLVENFGFVNGDVFFQLNCVKGKLPRENDTVRCEATFNAKMPFKWTATSVQIHIPSAHDEHHHHQHHRNGTAGADKRGLSPPHSRSRKLGQSPPTRRSSPPLRRYSPTRRRPPGGRSSRSPRRIGSYGSSITSAAPGFSSGRSNFGAVLPSTAAGVAKRRVPRHLLTNVDLESTSLTPADIRRRYPSMYIPSDFVHASVLWHTSFPLLNPLELGLSHCAYAICPSDRTLPGISNISDVCEQQPPSDTSYNHVAKVVLLACPPRADIHDLCLPPSSLPLSSTSLSSNRHAGGSASHHAHHLPLRHPIELIQLLVGLKGGRYEAIGGPWSPSLDGEDPSQPQTLINTAIRWTRHLTGVDLSACTSWPKICEVRYRRDVNGVAHKEIVTLYLPDVWRCLPTLQEWADIVDQFRTDVINQSDGSAKSRADALDGGDSVGGDDECNDVGDDREYRGIDNVAGLTSSQDSSADKGREGGLRSDATYDDDQSQQSCVGDVFLSDGSDPRQMKVADLRVELERRGLDTKGLKQALSDRLIQYLLAEKSKKSESELPKNLDRTHQDPANDSSATLTEKIVSGNDQDLESRLDDNDQKPPSKDAIKEVDKKADKTAKKEPLPVFELPNTPVIVVLPNRKAKGGKFDCRLMYLTRLLEYSEADNKEFMFELNLFAEFLKSMFYRDHAFNLYKNLLEAPDLYKEQENRLAAKKKREERKKDDKKDDHMKSSEAVAENDEIEIEIKDEVDEDYEKIYDEKIVRNPDLLLSCLFFDLNRVFYLNVKEVEDILLSLNLCLCRSQIRNILKKVLSKDANFEYKKLTHRNMNPEEPPEGFEYPTTLSEEELQIISKGNRLMIGLSTEESTLGVSASNAFYIDLDKLRHQVDKTERARVEVDTALIKTKDELEKVQHQLDRVRKNRDHLESDLLKANSKIDDLNEQLRLARRFSVDLRYTAQNARNGLSKILENLAYCLDREKKKSLDASSSIEKKDPSSTVDVKTLDAEATLENVAIAVESASTDELSVLKTDIDIENTDTDRMSSGSLQEKGTDDPIKAEEKTESHEERKRSSEALADSSEDKSLSVKEETVSSVQGSSTAVLRKTPVRPNGKPPIKKKKV